MIREERGPSHRNDVRLSQRAHSPISCLTRRRPLSHFPGDGDPSASSGPSAVARVLHRGSRLATRALGRAPSPRRRVLAVKGALPRDVMAGPGSRPANRSPPSRPRTRLAQLVGARLANVLGARHGAATVLQLVDVVRASAGPSFFTASDGHVARPPPHLV